MGKLLRGDRGQLLFAKRFHQFHIWLVWQEGHSIKDELGFNCPLGVPTGFGIPCYRNVVFFLPLKSLETGIENCSVAKRWLFFKQYPICLLQKGVICKYIKTCPGVSVRDADRPVLLEERFVEQQ